MGRKDNTKHILVAPALIIFVVITIFPLIFTVVMSLCNWQLGGTISFIGLKNYGYAFTNRTFWITLRNTLVMVLLSVSIEYLVAMLLAYNINKLMFGKKLIRVVMLLPMLMAPVVIGFMWKQLFNELYGPLNAILGKFGINGIKWISQSGISIISIVLVDVWEWTPFITIILLAGFQSLPKEPLESARVDGASEWRIFKDITFGMLLPASVVAITLRAIETFKIFDTIYIITAGGPGISSMSSTMYAYQVGLRNFNLGKAAAMCVLILVVIMLFSEIVTKAMAKNKERKEAQALAVVADVDFSEHYEGQE
ncbi:MAG: carbohydrate ABC transporter permease [Flexilinea sp.]